MGSPIGVVVIANNITPDGRARIMALNDVKVNGTFGPANDYTTKYDVFPITDNVGSTTTGSNSRGYMPSDNTYAMFNIPCVTNPLFEYARNELLIPSLYSGSGLNPECFKEIEGHNNALLDLDGIGNTRMLVSLSNENYYANTCWNYRDGFTNLRWYLPSIGELALMFARQKSYTYVLEKYGSKIVSDKTYCSSTESIDGICTLNTNGGYLTVNTSRFLSISTRPFAII